MLALWLTALSLNVAAGPTCISRDNQIACGYQCTSNLESLACAQTADGLCAATPTKVGCWDPPPDIRQLLAADPTVPRPSCVVRGASVACGFNCTTTLTKAACANTPMGNCLARFGQIQCWDPAPEVRWAMEESGRLEYAQCDSTLDQIACGYHCLAALSQVRCSGSPAGLCERHFDLLACFDPAPTLQLPTRSDPR